MSCPPKTKYVTISVQDDSKPKDEFYKKKLFKMHSITDKYQRKLPDNLIFTDELMKAVSRNDQEACKKILSEKDLSTFNEGYYFHPLLLAAKKRRFEIMKMLLDSGADIDVQDRKGFNALHYAIQQRSLECCNLLLERNIKLQVEDKFGNLPLHLAASEGMLEIVNKLLDQNQNPNARNKKDQTPLHFACIKGNEDVLELLLDKNGRWDFKDNNFWLPLHYAAFHGHYACCSILVERSGDKLKEHLKSTNKDKATPLILAAKRGHSRCCVVLKDSDINAADNHGNTALHLATSRGFLKTVEVLLTLKPNALVRNRDGNTSIHKAALQKNFDCLKLLVEFAGINPGLNNSNQTVIHLAALNNVEESLKYLLENPVFKEQINFPDKDGKTALHLSLQNSHSESSEILITSGINCTLSDDKGNIPLHVAAGGGMLNICKLLLSGSRVQKINERNIYGTTPLHFASMNGLVECCNFLLTKGADLNAIDSDGLSPLHIASNEGNLEVIKLFTKKGGYINQLVETTGESALHLASRKGFYECCVFILKNIKKDLIIKVNNVENSALDEAFNNENDQIFGLILSNILYPTTNRNEKYNLEQYYSLQSSLHEYLHAALEGQREVIQDAIVRSNWWYSGFSSSFCSMGQCPNLINLTEANPDLTEFVYQKCIEDDGHVTRFNFLIFEDTHYIPRISNNEHMKRQIAFNQETGRLEKEAIPFEKVIDHPLTVAVRLGLMNLMEHPLTEAYLDYKWNTYMKFILLTYLFLEFFLVVVLGLYLSFIKNYDMVANFTVSDFCSNGTDASSAVQEIISLRWNGIAVTFAILLAMTVIILVSELRWCFKMKKTFTSMASALGVYRLLGILLFIFPVHMCIYDIAIKQTWQWQIGIVTLLFSWFHMIHKLNEIPSMSVFMPVTTQFLKSFLRVLFYILLIVFIFAFLFHLMLSDHKAFESLPISFIKTTVWILGDLAYDDMFLNDESPIAYPVMANVIFVLLVTSISGFIVNMIIAQPTDHLEVFRNSANYYRVALRINLFQRTDLIFDSIRKRKLISFYDVPNLSLSAKCKKALAKEESSIQNGKGNDGVVSTDQLLKTIIKRLENIETQIAEIKKS